MSIRKALSWLIDNGFTEKNNVNRYPKGSPRGGQFAPGSGKTTSSAQSSSERTTLEGVSNELLQLRETLKKVNNDRRLAQDPQKFKETVAGIDARIEKLSALKSKLMKDRQASEAQARQQKERTDPKELARAEYRKLLAVSSRNELMSTLQKLGKPDELAKKYKIKSSGRGEAARYQSLADDIWRTGGVVRLKVK